MTQEATEVPALRGATAQLVVPNAGDVTWATVTLDDRSVAAVPRVLASVPDAQARAVVWIALIDGTCLGTVDPRVMVETFAAAWPHEDNSSILTRTMGSLLGRVIPTFLPPGEQDGAGQVVAQAAATLLGTAEPGGTAALVAARPSPGRRATTSCCTRGPPARSARPASTTTRTSAGSRCATSRRVASSSARSSSTPVTPTTRCRGG